MSIEKEPADIAPIQDENTRLMNSGLTPGLPLNVKTTKGGGLDLAKANPGRLMDKDTETNVLQNMQKLADQINNPMRKFTEGLKDVTAWTQYNKGPAFALREEAANTDRRALYDVAQQQAAIKNAQAQAAAAKQRIDSMMGKGTAGGTGTSPTAGRLPPNVIAALMAVDPSDIAAQQAIIDNYYKTDVTEATKMGYNPSAYKQEKRWNDKTQQYEMVDPLQILQAQKNAPTGTANAPSAATGQGNLPLSTRQNNPGNLVDPKTGQIRTYATPEEGDAALTKDLGIKLSGQSNAVHSRFGPQVGNFMSPSLLAETWAPSTAKGNTPESTQNYGKAIADALGMADPTAQIPNTPEALAKAKMAITKFEAGNNYPAPTAPAQIPVNRTLSPNESIVGQPAAPAPTAPAPTAPAPTAPAPTAPAAGNMPAFQRADLAFEEAKKRNEANIEAGKHRAITAGTEAGKSYSKMKELVETADTLSIPTAEAVLEIARDPNRSKVLAYLHGGDKVATAMHTIDKRLNPNKPAAELEEQFISNKFGPQALEDYRVVKNASDKLGIAYAADVFKGARMGIGLEKMAQNAKGIGTELPAAVNAKNAQLIIDAANFQKTKSKMYDDWAASHGGQMADFHEFESTPEYVKFRDDAKNHFIQTYKGLVKPEAGTSGSSKAQQEIDRRKKGN